MADQSSIAFVAYPSKDKNLLSTIREGIAKATARTAAIRFEPWEFNDIAGTPLVSPIIKKIGGASVVIADITYLNLNVIYEIGYAIGKKKTYFSNSSPRNSWRSRSSDEGWYF